MMDDAHSRNPVVGLDAETKKRLEAAADNRVPTPLPTTITELTALREDVSAVEKSYLTAHKLWRTRANKLALWSSMSSTRTNLSAEEFAELMKASELPAFPLGELAPYLMRQEFITLLEHKTLAEYDCVTWEKTALELRAFENKPLALLLNRVYDYPGACSFTSLAKLASSVADQCEACRAVLKQLNLRVMLALDGAKKAEATVVAVQVHVPETVVNISNHIDTTSIAEAIQKPEQTKRSKGFDDKPSEPSKRDRKITVVKAILLKQHFDDDGKIIERQRQPLTYPAIIGMVQNGAAAPQKGWSTPEVSKIFDEIFGGKDKYEHLLAHDTGKLYTTLNSA